MGSGMRPSRWPWLLIALIALIEPATHAWLKYGWVGAGAHSGLHIGDTPFFLTSMRIFTNDFFSPYAVCTSSEGPNNPWLFALPHHWVYGGLGWIADRIGLDAFLALGIANGLAGAFFLAMALRFFRFVMPARADLAFVIFCLGGGIGGLLWLGTLPFGVHGQAGFEGWFHRFARYELIEGPFLLPALVMPRLYYTLPLGIGFAALMAFISAAGREHPMPDKKAILLQFLCTYLNARVGILFWGVAVCFIAAQPVVRRSRKWRYGLYYLLPTAVAAMLVSIPFGMNSHGAANVAMLLRRSAWFGSLVTATLLLWPAAGLALWRHIGQLGWMGRLVAGACLGYGTAFLVLYVGHQTWYGNWLAGGETAAAIAVSDWALIGALAAPLALLRRGGVAPEAEAETWVALWFLGLASVSIAAVGQGWFLRAMPERGLVLLGPALAILTAEGIGMIGARWPRAARLYIGGIVIAGAVSLGVGALCFQGPLGHTPGQPPFRFAHSEVVLPEDLALLDLVNGGTLLAPASLPPLIGDVAVARSAAIRTPFGQPTLEFGDVSMAGMAREIDRFFAPGISETYRAIFIRDWCVDFVLCPATHPVDPAVIEALDALPWLARIASEGDAVLYRVIFRPGGDPYV